MMGKELIRFQMPQSECNFRQQITLRAMMNMTDQTQSRFCPFVWLSQVS